MSVNFFQTTCQSQTNKKIFGLYDAEDKTPAIVTFDEDLNWNATVLNEEEKEVLFTAIDNCIEMLRENGEMENRCDGILQYDNVLLFVELKNKREAWQAEGLAQIEVTIRRIKEANETFYLSFSKRKAIVANAQNQKPNFQVANMEQREYFMREYKVRLQFEAEIIIK